jgi:hypothetical protein
VDVDFMIQSTRRFERYVAALLRCNGTSVQDWVEAKKELELLHPYHVFDDDPALIEAFRQGDEKARLSLGGRGLLLHSVEVFGQPYDKDKWEAARVALVASGKPGQVILVTTLLTLLMNGRLREVWPHLRYHLIETGPMALETSAAVARDLSEKLPGDKPLIRLDTISQVIAVLIGFGDGGRPFVEELARSPKLNVRRAVCAAVALARDDTFTTYLVKIVSSDPEWIVRASAAEALGRMVPATAGPVLVDRMKKEPDPIVLKVILEAIGNLHYEEAVPVLIRSLDVPSLEMSTGIMSALYHITGEKLTRREEWTQWYATEYPRWKARPPR